MLFAKILSMLWHPPSLLIPRGVDSEKYVKDYFKANGMELSNMLVRTKIQTKLANIVSIQFVKPVDESIVTAITALDVSRVQRIARPTPFIAKESTSALYAPESIHSITGVNDARNKLGLTGKGIKVAIIDSGVDYNHEALGRVLDLDSRCLMVTVNLVGDSYSASSPPVEDSDPLDDCSDVSHGTHVSGIVAADATALKKPEWATDVSFTGVAPEATLGAYRVFSCDGGGTESDIIAKAIYMAAEDGSDIINLSLGGGPTFADYSTSVAATRVGEAGHLVISANGNSGSRPFVKFSAVKHQFNIGGNNGNFDFTKDYEVVINYPTADELDKLDDGLSVSPPLPLARLSSSVGVVWFLAHSPLATTHDLGREMLKAAKEGKPLALKVSDKLGLFDLATAGTVSDFSSLGLDLELAIKPDLGGIGGEVYSTVFKHSQEAGRPCRRCPHRPWSHPRPNATLTTGVYDLYNGFASTIPENSVHNLTEAGLLVIPIVATSSRFARVEAIYKGRDWKTQLHLIGTSIPLNPDATGAISPGGIANLYANPLQRNHYDGDSRPTAYYFEGSVLSNLTDPDAALSPSPPESTRSVSPPSSTLDVSTPPLPETTLTLSTPTPLTLSTKPLLSKKTLASNVGRQFFLG
ncbi:peptidase S8/S53 domain-containing protein [Chytridium lagenaria]|nr:peptidase S8/S53 domain-containing protein [Chytridium lagenaria]